jgi:high-affinity Fe2+/Pb2+ permease
MFRLILISGGLLLLAVAGIVVYAVDTLIMNRPRAWNFKEVFLDSGRDGHRVIRQRAMPFMLW